MNKYSIIIIQQRSKKMNLYELTENYIQVLELAETSEFDLTDTMESIEEAIELKAENTAKVIKQLEANAEMLANEAKRLSDRKSAIENNVRNLKRYLQEQLEKCGKAKIKGDLFTVAIQNNPPGVAVVDESKIPLEFFVEQAPQLNRRELLKHLKIGQQVPGAELRQSQSLRIR